MQVEIFLMFCPSVTVPTMTDQPWANTVMEAKHMPLYTPFRSVLNKRHWCLEPPQAIFMDFCQSPRTGGTVIDRSGNMPTLILSPNP